MKLRGNAKVNGPQTVLYSSIAPGQVFQLLTQYLIKSNATTATVLGDGSINSGFNGNEQVILFANAYFTLG